MDKTEKITADYLVKEFNVFVEANPANRIRKKISYPKREMMLKPLVNVLWHEIEEKKETISDWVKQYGSSRKDELSDKTIELAWMWVARAYEFGVIKKIIPTNPLKYRLPTNPKTGSYID